MCVYLVVKQKNQHWFIEEKKKIITVFLGRTWLVKRIKIGEIQMKSSVERRIYR